MGEPETEAVRRHDRFPRWLFLLAGLYGLLVLLPQYFLEEQLGRDYPPAITHPEHFYGFVGVAISWQIAFLIIAMDPVRFRLFMLPAILEKFSFGVAVMVLFAQERVPGIIAGFAAADLVLAGLFVLAFSRTGRENITGT